MIEREDIMTKYGLYIYPNAVSHETCELLSRTIKQESLMYKYFTNSNQKNDELVVDNSFSMYGPMCLEALTEMLLPKMEKVTGKKLAPTYSYTRIYYNGASMDKHTDRPSCEYSATLTLSITEKPWLIWVKDLTGDERPVNLLVGDMCVYKGQTVPHWRDRYEGEEQIQAFLHYVDVNGPNAKFKYDGRPMMGMHPSTRRKGE